MSTTVTSVAEVNNSIPREAALEQNYPNPFNPTTNFEFSVATSSRRDLVLVNQDGRISPLKADAPPAHDFSASGAVFVSLKVFDVLGKEVATLVEEYLPPGTYKKTWNAAGIPSGVYFYRLQSGSVSEIRRLLLVR
jgi:hypothetical protein